ncbi:HSF-type DNA-binding-domain-containing protein [Phascolomyces articulosus]|uniref:HSF-type DNA-binding-domain-containing protein n=1 Tax=Phascolomyces articulosus TaxID=60185 RepID=A0AAD5KGI5_9FUNG|nr:HSF-type DNA-binding-domain-containing protein [Phascolomyces articulosus]
MERREKCGNSTTGIDEGLLGMFTVQPMNTPTFITKLYTMVDDSKEECIVWSTEGDHFKVISPNTFSKTVLPQYFKHSNWTSFVRQLNMYGFHKVSEYRDQLDRDVWSFKQPSFYRGGKQVLHLIRRKRVSHNGEDTSTTSMVKTKEDDNSVASDRISESPVPIALELQMNRIEAAISKTQNQFSMMEAELRQLRSIFQEQQKLALLVKDTLDGAPFIKNKHVNNNSRKEGDDEGTFKHYTISSIIKDTNPIEISPTTTFATTNTAGGTVETIGSTSPPHHVCHNLSYDPAWDCMKCSCQLPQQEQPQLKHSTTALKQKGASIFIQQPKDKPPN